MKGFAKPVTTASFTQALGTVLERFNEVATEYNDIQAAMTKSRVAAQMAAERAKQAHDALDSLRAEQDALQSQMATERTQAMADIDTLKQRARRELDALRKQLEHDQADLQAAEARLAKRLEEANARELLLTNQEAAYDERDKGLTAQTAQLVADRAQADEQLKALTGREAALDAREAEIKAQLASAKALTASVAKDKADIGKKLTEAEDLLADAKMRKQALDAREEKLKGREKIIEQRMVEITTISRGLKVKEARLNDRENLLNSHL